jgi:hypothetical protein
MLRSLVALGFSALAVPAFAGEAGDIALRHLYGGTAEQGIAELTPRADAEARFGKGLLQFTVAMEHFAQALYRHGFAPNWGGGGGVGGPMFIPVPANPSPEPIDYDTLRELLDAFVTDLDVAQKTLLEAGVAGDYVIPLDVLKVGLDIDGDGKSAPEESMAAIMGAAMGAPPELPEGQTPVFGLDRADAIWLAGYTNIVAVQADFLLAHDFHELFDSTFHRLFPAADLPLADHVTGLRDPAGGYELFDPDSEIAIADAIAAIHTLDWPVAEPDRLKRVRDRLLTLTGLSRQNWEAILAEKDNDRELLPNPGQTAAIGNARLTQEQIDAWLATLDTLDEVLEGRLLLPHWRFRQGFDLKAYFETATNTDIVMLLSGYDALPYLKDGPIASADSFAALNGAFGADWPGYAFWFN